MNFRRVSIRLLAVLAVLLVAVLIGGYAMYRSRVRSSGLEVALQWARMAPLPESASDLAVETRGGPFTREFTIRFNAPRDDVKAWLDKSPGTSKLTPAGKDNIRIYTVEPGGGAMHAEVKVDDNLGSVSIHTFWS